MWPLTEGWAPLLDPEACLSGQNAWVGQATPPKFLPHFWASVEPLLSSCEQINVTFLISCEQGSNLSLPLLRNGSEPGFFSVWSPFVLLSLSLCSIYYGLQDQYFTDLFFFFWHVPCKPRISLHFNS